MRSIYFIGNVKAKFASRWRRELAPDQVKVGKQLSKEKSKALKGIQSGQERRLVGGGYKSLTKVNNKIDQVSKSAKTQKSNLLRNKADPLIDKNKKLRSYLENRKVKKGLNSNVLSKDYQAPKTLKVAAKTNNIRAKRMIEKSKPAITPEVLPPLSEKLAVRTPKSNKTPGIGGVPKKSLLSNPNPKVNSIGVPKKSLLQKAGTFLNRNKGKGLAAAGVGALGYAAYKMKKDKNRK